MIAQETIKEYGAGEILLQKDEILFREGSHARFYYQVKDGAIKMSTYNHEGKEFIQGIFKNDQSFGEPALFGDFPYPASAIAQEKTILYKLSKEGLVALLRNHFDIQMNFIGILSQRLQYKAMIMKEISGYNPEHRIITLIDHLKKEVSKDLDYEVTLTRQQIADLLGLRVETVIRAVKHLEKSGELKIIKRKIFR
ncbi:Crp/Fnr family transcriptional regulator [Fulvivirgaceae bacterium BMA10]|uniref:Crp/Fnr family transcriptional regulator n=1 Tax=Splendidivirga corallicola TaxID=3051826 RepID=A0ABT8KMQ3_9BACT|nr:Crp/Fnr family transcriptional regulator [Fulvivirgaceae bacterium BMA10]